MIVNWIIPGILIKKESVANCDAIDAIYIKICVTYIFLMTIIEVNNKDLDFYRFKK